MNSMSLIYLLLRIDKKVNPDYHFAWWAHRTLTQVDCLIERECVWALSNM